MTPELSWNLVDDLNQMLAYPFMVTALLAGTVVAVVTSCVGWFMVLRRESFAGHTLAVVGFPGGAGAAWLGVATGYGYLVACVLCAVAIAALPPLARATGVGAGGGGEESAVIGTLQALALATGLLFVSLYHGFLSGLTGLLFGTIAGVTTDQLHLLVIAAAACLAALAAIGRPLLWVSIDPESARAQGVPLRLVSTVFLLGLGVAAAGASQITGSLLVFALLVAPAAAAFQLTARPTAGIAVALTLALFATWAGLACAFFSPYPAGFWVATFAFGSYLLAGAYRTVTDRSRQRVAA